MSYKLAGVTWNDDGTMAVESIPPFKALSMLTYRANNDNDTDVEDCLEWYNIVAAELRALDIIKDKIDIGVVILGDKPKIRITYDGLLRFYDISQEEYDLLKEVL